MIKLKEAQKVGATFKDNSGRTVVDSKLLFRDLFINPEHIISINEEYSSDSNLSLTRIETLKGSFIVLGTPSEIQNHLINKNSKQNLLKD